MFHIEFHEEPDAAGRSGTVLRHAGQDVGRRLMDAPQGTAGYRFLPVFYLAHAVCLGWSPNTEALLPGTFLPRHPATGAGDAEEESLLALFTLQFARSLAEEDRGGAPTPALVDGVVHLATPLALPCSAEDWTRALDCGLTAWRDLREGRGTRVLVDPEGGRLKVVASASA
jgi:hypothetical protein